MWLWLPVGGPYFTLMQGKKEERREKRRRREALPTKQQREKEEEEGSGERRNFSWKEGDRGNNNNMEVERCKIFLRRRPLISRNW